MSGDPFDFSHAISFDIEKSAYITILFQCSSVQKREPQIIEHRFPSASQ